MDGKTAAAGQGNTQVNTFVKTPEESGKKRLSLLDTIRGITIVSMILYHGAWDLVYIAGVRWPWYHSQGAFVWQQTICWSFILLSGFCIPFSRHLWKRGCMVFGAGMLVTLVTSVFLPQDRVLFGVLTMIGSAMLIMAVLDPALKKCSPLAGLLISAYLFYLTRELNSGYLQLVPGVRLYLPSSLFHGMPATYLGFMEPGFWSADYFSLLPWIFLYLCGYFLCLLLRRYGMLETGSGNGDTADKTGQIRSGSTEGVRAKSLRIWQFSIQPFVFMGRHSLLIYLLHQPVIYLAVVLLMRAGAL